MQHEFFSVSLLASASSVCVAPGLPPLGLKRTGGAFH
jgi:hypothetical protein